MPTLIDRTLIKVISTPNLMHTKVNETTFSGQSIFLGIDVHLKSWKVTVIAGDIVHKTLSSTPQVDKLHSYEDSFSRG